MNIAVIGSILRWGFRIINWNHFRIKAHNGKPRIKRIIKLKGFRTALIEEYNGNRCTSRFYWRVGIWLGAVMCRLFHPIETLENCSFVDSVSGKSVGKFRCKKCNAEC
jgi:hypothetical protein